VLFLAGWMAMVSGTVTEGFTQIIREPLSFLILFGIPVLALYVPDFIALRGDPSDKVPGAPGVGATGAATLLQRYGSLEAALKAGRFPAMAETLRLYRSIATMNRKAPLPSLRSQRPTWNKAAALAREWELNQLARRLKELGPLGDG
jgi:DNA polymerase-1